MPFSFFNLKKSILFSLFILLFSNSIKANDSDVVNCNHAWKIVVIGSSTSYGMGATVYDSSWVGRFTYYIKSKNSLNEVINLGTPGFKTYENLRPDGYVPPANRPSPVAGYNITAALSYHPDAIIINMPSNDAVNDYTLAEQQANYEAAIHLADSAKVTVWVTTTQPRNYLTTAQVQNLIDTRAWILTRFGNKAVDFWDGVANPDGSISSVYVYDYVHVTNLGHNLFFTRMRSETILDSLCNRSGSLTVNAGSDKTLLLPVNYCNLNGTANSSLGSITSYNWTKISGPASYQISSPLTSGTAITGLTVGNYSFELKVSDSKLNTTRDTIIISVNCSSGSSTGSTTNITKCSSLLPYAWNGANYSATGTYTKTLTNTAGCDSIATLVLTVKASSTSTSNVSKCSNQVPYSWNGTSYSVSGTYTKSFTNTVGCDSIAILILTIKSTTTSTTNVMKCTNQLPYSWNGTNYSVAGTYTKTLTNAAGCDSVAKLILTIKATSTSTTNITICSSLLPFQWNGSSYSTAGTYTKTLSNSFGCDSVATLKLTIKNSSTSSTSISRCLNQLPYLWNGTNYSIAGTYTYTTNNSVGCDSVATLVLTAKSTSTSSTPVSVCSNQLPYLWNGTNYSIAGTYNYTTNNSVGCDSVATLVLTVKSTSTSSTPVSVCSNQLPYLWNGANYSIAGTYTYTTNNSVGCDSVSALIFTVNPTTTSLTSYSICSNQLPYLWNGTNYYTAGTYTYTTNNTAGCDSVATLVLTINELPTVNAGNYSSLFTTSASITLTGTPAGGAFSGTGVSENTFNPAVSGAGVFTITYTYSDPLTGCSNLTTTNISVSVLCNFSVATAITGNTNVCGNIGVGDSAVYAISAVDAVSYAWSVSSATTMGMSLIRNGSSVKIKYGSTFTTGTVTVVVTGCNSTTVTKTLAITKTVPGAPANITDASGNTATAYICPYIGGSNVTYVATAPATNASAVIAYRWTLPAGSVLVSVNAVDSSSITIKYPATPTSLSISVIAVSGCGNSAAKSLALSVTAPATPGTIAGLADVCASIGSGAQSGNVTYSIVAVNNAASYLWVVPARVTIVSGQGTTSLNVKFDSLFVSGAITVQSISPCGNSIAKSLTVYKRVSAASSAIQKEFTPTSILAVTSVCGLSSETYRTKKVTYATSYNWSLALGTNATITHVNASGINDTAVIVTFLNGFTKDTLSLKTVTPCSVSIAKTVALSAILLPPTVSAISGSLTPCIGSVITYTATAPAPTTSQSAISIYRWTKPANTTITSAAVDSSSITLSYNTGFTGGAITAKGQSACGIAGTAKSVSLMYLPPTPTGITSSTGLYNACIGTPITFTVVVAAPTTAQLAASVYRWTKPNNTTITSANTDSSVITVQFNTGYTGGSLTVKGQTVCGAQGTAKSQALTHTGCPTGTVAPLVAKSDLYSSDNEVNTFTIYPNPNNGNFEISIQLKEADHSLSTINISDIFGNIVKKITVGSLKGKIEASVRNLNLPKGIYFVNYNIGKSNQNIKMIIN